MAAPKAGPIVITLKKRLGGGAPAIPSRRSTEPPSAADEELVVASGRGASRSRSPRGSLRGSSSPRSPAGEQDPEEERGDARESSPVRGPVAPTIAPSPVLNHTALEDIFARFHGELDTWLRVESDKLERLEARGTLARDSLKKSADLVCDYVRDHSPSTYADLGQDPGGDTFTTRTLPQLLDLIDEDRVLLQDMMGVLTQFADRRFPKNEELSGLKAGISPLPLFSALLRLLATQQKTATARRAAAA